MVATSSCNILGLLIILHFIPIVLSSIANPRGFQERQPDGSMTPKMYLHGNAHNHHILDEEGYFILENNMGWFVYAELNEKEKLIPGTVPVGKTNTKNNQVEKNSFPRTDHFSEGTEIKVPENDEPKDSWYIEDRRTLDVNNRVPVKSGELKNLVLLMRFSDHKDRTLPTKANMDKYFNKLGGDPDCSPTGSIRDVFLHSSYGMTDIVSTIYGWVSLPESESYYANKKNGFSTVFVEAIHDALEIMDKDNQKGFSVDDFDSNKDGFIDLITFLHSGYGAEWGVKDCYGAHLKDRIWSHKHSLDYNKQWKSVDGTIVHAYHVSTILHGTCGSKIGRIGTVAHELGHFFELPDLYDSSGEGSGVGSYCLMGDSWGFDNSQFYPGMMSPWAKIKLGWVSPTILSDNGQYSLRASALAKEIFRINIGFHEDEYLLIENRQKIGFDKKLPESGLAIWHIDEKADQSSGGYPGQHGWPTNGKHYKVALLAADGNYGLENAAEKIFKNHLYHKNGVNKLLPSDNSSKGPFPNTDAYQGGLVKKSGVNIYDISDSGEVMTFKLSFKNYPPTPSTYAPTLPANMITKQITTTYEDTSGLSGNMFSIVAFNDLIIRGMHIHMMSITMANIEIWTKKGSYKEYVNDKSSWKNIATLKINGLGPGKSTPLPPGSFNPIKVKKGEMLSFYVTLARSTGMRYTTGTKEGNMFRSNSDLKILEGAGVAYPFGEAYVSRVWNGAILYQVEEEHIPTLMPTKTPAKPSTMSPTQSPISGPTNTEENQLITTFQGGSGSEGNMFTVKVASRSLVITGMYINILPMSNEKVQVWMRKGSYIGYDKDKTGWTKHVDTRITSKKGNTPTAIPASKFGAIKLDAHEQMSFYVTVVHYQGMRYTEGTKEGNEFVSNGDLSITEGKGLSYKFGASYAPRVWNGIILYRMQKGDTDSDQTLSPTMEPNKPNPSVNECTEWKKWNKKKKKCVEKCKAKKGKRYDWSKKKCVPIVERERRFLRRTLSS